MKKRMLTQDIVKGIAILIVVQLHTLQLTKVTLYLLAGLFGYVMPVFMFLSGYNYHPKGLTPWQRIKKRVGALLKIYLKWSFLIFILMAPYFYLRKEGTMAEIIKSFAIQLLSNHGAAMLGIEVDMTMFRMVLGPCWFLQFLISSSIIFYLAVDYALKSFRNTFSIVSLLIMISYIFLRFDIVLLWGFHFAPAIAGVMIIAARLAQDNHFFDTSNKKIWTIINSLVCLLIVDAIQLSYPMAGLLGAGVIGTIAGANETFFFVCFAVFGTYFLINLSKLIEKIPYVSTALIWFGQHSLEVLLLHRPLSWVIIDMMKLPHFVSGHPLYVDKISWPDLAAFLLNFAIMVPLIMLNDYLKAKRKAGTV